MFRAAQFLVRHKIGVVAVVAIGVVVFGRGGDERKAVNPWGTDAAQQAASDAQVSLADKAIGVAAGAARDYAGVDVGKFLPGSLKKDTVDNWQSAGDAARRANGN
ncbi:hypothetical protein ACFOD9_07780 [Novosphingobium bradum]|uniref:Uncharacterized protein n=1 Tax=Novosphingobium bradum TaxID=1737444 RepID=A0ABV7ISG0_9SPHN